MSRFVPNSKYVKYRDGTWIECRKRIYLYWFKFLRHAEQSSDHKVQWNKYRAWSGKNAVMNMKFDDWWEDHWKDCFGIDEETGRSKFYLDKNPKADGIRYALLCYENRDCKSNWDIAIAISKQESRGRGIYNMLIDAREDLNTKGNMKWGFERKRVRDESSPTGYSIEYVDNTNQEYDDKIYWNQQKKRKIQSVIGRYKRQADLHLENVSKGLF